MLLPIVAFVVVTACGSQGSSWVGTYKGVLPCANCEGVETILTLKPDTTYVLKISFLGAATTIPDITGKFDWTAENTFTLDNEDYLSADYIFSEGILFQRDLDGKMVEGPDAGKFIFTKQ